jgi:hypothetical protein
VCYARDMTQTPSTFAAPIMPFEGLLPEDWTHTYGPLLDLTPEDGPSPEDEDFYTTMILSGLLDEQEAERGDWDELTYDPDEGRMADLAADRWERAFWG